MWQRQGFLLASRWHSKAFADAQGQSHKLQTDKVNPKNFGLASSQLISEKTRPR
jgi:hypothetical protein